jgi:hypothetical protein
MTLRPIEYAPLSEWTTGLMMDISSHPNNSSAEELALHPPTDHCGFTKQMLNDVKLDLRYLHYVETSL